MVRSTDPVVLVITDECGETVDRVTAACTERGARVVVVSQFGLPLGDVLSVGDRVLHLRGQVISYSNCVGLWIWHPAPPAAPDRTEAARRYVAREWQLAIMAIASVLPPDRCINHPRACRWIDCNKIAQLRVAAAIG